MADASSCHLLCMTAAGGVPLFTRRRGAETPLPFAVGASLNGVALFGSSHNVELQSACSDRVQVFWRDFGDAVRLVLVVDNGDNAGQETHNAQQVLEQVFHAMVFVVGLDALQSVARDSRLVERVKRDLKPSYALVDAILSGDQVGFLTRTAEWSPVLDSQTWSLLQSSLDRFVESIDSTYGCLLLNHQVVVATKNFATELHSDEINLLIHSIMSPNPQRMWELQIHLPLKSPRNAIRVVFCSLMDQVIVLALCNNDISGTDIETFVTKCWKSSFHALNHLRATFLVSRSPIVPLDVTMLGLIAVKNGRSIALWNVGEDEEQERDDEIDGRRRKALLHFLLYSCRKIFEDKKGDHVAKECYEWRQGHKCLALTRDGVRLFALFIPQIPVHTMRTIGHRTLDAMLRDKMFVSLAT